MMGKLFLLTRNYCTCRMYIYTIYLIYLLLDTCQIHLHSVIIGTADIEINDIYDFKKCEMECLSDLLCYVYNYNTKDRLCN